MRNDMHEIPEDVRRTSELLDRHAGTLRREPGEGFEHRVADAARRAEAPIVESRPLLFRRAPMLAAAGLVLAASLAVVIVVMRPGPTPLADLAQIEEDVEEWLAFTDMFDDGFRDLVQVYSEDTAIDEAWPGPTDFLDEESI